MRKTPRGWIQIGESRTRGVARIPLGLKPSRDSRATSQRDSPIWIQPLGVFRYRIGNFCGMVLILWGTALSMRPSWWGGLFERFQCHCLLNQGPDSIWRCYLTWCQYKNSHCGDKTVIRLSYIHHGNSYIGKTTSLYWISPQVFCLKHEIYENELGTPI